MRPTRLIPAALTALLIQPGTAANPPNIICILADDLGYGDIQALNPQRGKIPTPHLDQLAASGMVFTQTHTPPSSPAPSGKDAADSDPTPIF
jgi:hypothetical protein